MNESAHTKTCTKCLEEKPVESFNWQNKKKGTRASHCKACRKLYNQANREYINEMNRARYAANCESAKAYQKAYRAANASQVSMSNALLRATNVENNVQKSDDLIRTMTPEKYCPSCDRTLSSQMFGIQRDTKQGLAGRCRPCDSSRESRKLAGVRYRARKKSTHIEDVRKEVLRERDGDNCGVCGVEMTFFQLKRGEYVPTNWEHEHLKAISQGGENSYENSTLLCSRCNRSKQGKTIPEFILYREARGLPIQLNAHVAKVVHELTYPKEATCTSSTGA